MNEELEIFPDGDLDVFFETLKEAEENGQHVYANFNGHILHSKDMKTVDDAYMAVMGRTKEEQQQVIEESNRRNARERLEAQLDTLEKIPERIERGERIIFPERYEEWEKVVHSSVNGLYQGVVLDYALDVMEALDQGASIEEAQDLLTSKDPTRDTEKIVRDTVLMFSSRGPDFWEATSPYGAEYIPDHIRTFLDAKREENRRLADFHDITDGQGIHI